MYKLRVLTQRSTSRHVYRLLCLALFVAFASTACKKAKKTEDVSDDHDSSSRAKPSSSAAPPLTFEKNRFSDGSCSVHRNFDLPGNVFSAVREPSPNAKNQDTLQSPDCGKWTPIINDNGSWDILNPSKSIARPESEACSHIDWARATVGERWGVMPVKVERNGKSYEGEVEVDLELCTKVVFNNMKGPLLFKGETATTEPVKKPKGVLFVSVNSVESILASGSKSFADMDWIASASVRNVRTIKCQYQGGVSDTADAFDHEVTLIDRRSGKVIEKKLFVAAPPKCESTVTVGKKSGDKKFGGGSYSSVKDEALLKWARERANR